MVSPFSEVAVDPRLHSIHFHPLGEDQTRVVAVDAAGEELGRISSVTTLYALYLVADAGIELGTQTVHEGGISVFRVVPRI